MLRTLWNAIDRHIYTYIHIYLLHLVISSHGKNRVKK